MRETKFKQTDIGLYPVDWDCIALSDKCKTSSGGTPSRVINAYWTNGNIKWVTTGELRDCAIEDTIEHITDLGLQNSSAKIFPNGTLLIAMYGATIGKLGLLNTAAATNQACCAIIPNEEVDTLFLYYYLLSKRTHIMALGSGAGQPNISQNIIRALTIPLPPLAEQRKIAKALSDVDGLISSLAKLIEKKQNIKTATMQQLLTGKKRLEGFTEPWVEKELGSLCMVIKGEQLNRDKMNGDAIYPVYNGGISPSGCHSDYNTAPDTVIISEGGNSCGFVNFIHEPFWRGGHCYGLFGFEGNNDFFYQLLKFREKDIMKLRAGSGLPNIQKSNLNAFVVEIPNNFDEQIAIANILTSMDNEISALETKKAKYESIKKGMMQELLTGRIRLV